MNASYAKSPFSKTTLAQIGSYCAVELGVDIDMTVPKHVVSVFSRYMRYAKEFRSAISAQRIEQDGKLTSKQLDDLLSTVCVLEYITVMCSIFNERFLNRNWCLTKENIDFEEKELETSLQFIYNWVEEKPQFLKLHPSLKTKAWVPHIIAMKTYKNIRIGISGFLGYARQVLELDGITFVAGLHSNQSILESYFSCLRFHNNDTASKMGRSRAADNVRRTIKNSPTSLLKVKTRKDERTSTYNSWNGILGTRLESQIPVSFMKATSTEPKTTFSTIVKTGLKERLLDGGFVTLLLSDPTFVGFSKQSIGTNRENFFKTIVSRNLDSQKFDQGCQQIVERCWLALDAAVAIKSKNDYRRHYHTHILDILTQGEYVLSMKQYVECLDDSLGMAILYQIISNQMLRFIPKILISTFPRQSVAITVNDWKVAQATEMNRFFGWALFSMKKKQEKGGTKLGKMRLIIF